MAGKMCKELIYFILFNNYKAVCTCDYGINLIMTQLLSCFECLDKFNNKNLHTYICAYTRVFQDVSEGRVIINCYECDDHTAKLISLPQSESPCSFTHSLRDKQ